eukprot:5108630-Amphidinium_carterae.1
MLLWLPGDKRRLKEQWLRYGMQTARALSSGEAEWYACCAGAAELLYAQQLLRDGGINADTPQLQTDATEAKSLAAREGLSRIRHLADQKKMTVLKVGGTSNPADMGPECKLYLDSDHEHSPINTSDSTTKSENSGIESSCCWTTFTHSLQASTAGAELLSDDSQPMTLKVQPICGSCPAPPVEDSSKRGNQVSHGRANQPYLATVSSTGILPYS